MTGQETGGVRETGAPGKGHRRRLREIEDRKIEILMETAELNRTYDARVSALNEEYAELDAEYYRLRMDGMLAGARAAPQE